MLDKKSKLVLKILNKIKNDNNLIQGSDKVLEHQSKYDRKTIDSVLWYLESKGYVHCSNAENSIYLIQLAYEGINYNEFNWIGLKSFLFTSIFTPIVVAFITTLIVELIF